MGKPLDGRPDVDDLATFKGLVTKLQVDQTGSRDEIRVWISQDDATEPVSFNILLDEGATVALAQLQMLRDAILHHLDVKVWFYQHPDDPDEPYYVYRLRLYGSDEPMDRESGGVGFAGDGEFEGLSGAVLVHSWG